MASRFDPHFPTPRLSLWLPALVLTMMLPISVTESDAPIQLRGEVGGKVTFHCPVAKQGTFIFLYFQRGQDFVNGYYKSKNTSQMAWKNTRVDDDKTTMHMFNLSMSHSGDYQCHIGYSDNQVVSRTIHLTVTATYSTPALTDHCTDENHHFSCRVTCASHGGYPGTEVTWNISGSQIWNVVNSSKMTDPNTMLVNSSSTAYINCSDGGLTSLSCSVGDVTSAKISVCDKGKPGDLPNNTSPYVIAAICAVVGVTMVVALLLWWKRKKGQRRQSTEVTVRLENGLEEEVTILNETKDGKEASGVLN